MYELCMIVYVCAGAVVILLSWYSCWPKCITVGPRSVRPVVAHKMFRPPGIGCCLPLRSRASLLVMMRYHRDPGSLEQPIRCPLFLLQTTVCPTVLTSCWQHSYSTSFPIRRKIEHLAWNTGSRYDDVAEARTKEDALSFLATLLP